MRKRDLIFSGIGLFLVGSGILFAALGYTDIALMSLLIFGFFVLLVILLQRRQLGILQKRTLEILRSESDVEPVDDSVTAPLGRLEFDDAIHMSTKKLIGLLHAQQIQIEELSKNVSGLVNQTRDS